MQQTPNEVQNFEGTLNHFPAGKGVPTFTNKKYAYCIPDVISIAVMITYMSLLENGLDHCIAALNQTGVESRTVYVIIVSSQMTAELATKTFKEIKQKLGRGGPKYRRGSEILHMHDFFSGLTYLGGDHQKLKFPAENKAKSFVLRALDGSDGYLGGGKPNLKGLQKEDIESEDVITNGDEPLECYDLKLKKNFERANFTVVQLLMYMYKFFLEAEYEANPSQFTFEDNADSFDSNGEITAKAFKPGTCELMGCIPDELRFVQVLKDRVFSERNETKPFKITAKGLKQIFEVRKKKKPNASAEAAEADEAAEAAEADEADEADEGDEDAKEDNANNETNTSSKDAGEPAEEGTPTKRKLPEAEARAASATETEPTESNSPDSKKMRLVQEARIAENEFLKSMLEGLKDLQRLQIDKDRVPKKKRAREGSQDEEQGKECAKKVQELLSKVAERQKEVVDLTDDINDDDDNDDDDNESEEAGHIGAKSPGSKKDTKKDKE